MLFTLGLGQIYDIATSQHMSCGAHKSMAYVIAHAVKQLTGALQCFCPAQSAELKRITAKHIKPSSELRSAFEACCCATGVLHSLRAAMVLYTSAKSNVVKFKAGVVPELNTALNDTLRVAAMMIDPACVDLFGRMANPRQDRMALDNPELRIASVKQQLMEEVTSNYFNNVEWAPASIPDISSWCPDITIDVTVPGERRTWIWVASKIQYIKTGMTTLLSNFNKSGQSQHVHVTFLYF